VVIPVRDQPRDSGHSATVQAMACGKAVILSDTAGLWDRQLLRDGETCLLVPPENPAALREAMLRLWNDPTEAARIGLAARELVEKHWTARQFGEHLVQTAAGLLG
jgi:glycosyltransferase involved in cell wall biosynthesis